MKLGDLAANVMVFLESEVHQERKIRCVSCFEFRRVNTICYVWKRLVEKSPRHIQSRVEWQIFTYFFKFWAMQTIPKPRLKFHLLGSPSFLSRVEKISLSNGLTGHPVLGTI